VLVICVSVLSFSSRVFDYSKSALVSLLHLMIASLQGVQNAVSCLVFKPSTRDHVTSISLQLHGIWFSVANLQASHASWKVLDFFFLKIPGPGKSWKITLVLESPGN